MLVVNNSFALDVRESEAELNDRVEFPECDTMSEHSLETSNSDFLHALL